MQLDPPAKKGVKLSLTPLIDVVFLLLIFFMLASTFSRFSSLPLAVKSGQGQTTLNKNFILLRVGKDGAVDINGESVSSENLITRIDQLAVTADMKLVVKPREESTVQDLVTVLEKVRQSKIKNPIVAK